MWIDNKDSPKENGYYLTYYRYNEFTEYKDKYIKFLFRSFCWKNNEWHFKFKPDVICYWNVRYDSFIHSHMDPNVDPLPDIFKKT